MCAEASGKGRSKQGMRVFICRSETVGPETAGPKTKQRPARCPRQLRGAPTPRQRQAGASLCLCHGAMGVSGLVGTPCARLHARAHANGLG